MKRYSILFITLFVFLACTGKVQENAITINDIDISADEFEQAYQASVFSKMGNVKKKDFLDTFISRKLILLKAEKMGLDKDPAFLRDIQMFWEQSLLKRVLAFKESEIKKNIKVSDKEILGFFNAHLTTEFSGKSFDNVKPQIKQILVIEKQQEVIRSWINSLANNAKINIDYRKLGILKDK